MVVVHQDLEERTRKAHPKMKIVTLKNYLQDPVIDELVNEIVEAKNKE
jgi:PTS system mannitol-specific IIC component